MINTRLVRHHQIPVIFSHQLVPRAITPRQRLDDVVKLTSGLPFGGTDCALLMLWALEQKVAVDTFVVYTDSETWFGSVHPAEALRRYRAQMGIPAKLIVVGMVANGFSIADAMVVVPFGQAQLASYRDSARSSFPIRAQLGRQRDTEAGQIGEGQLQPASDGAE